MSVYKGNLLIAANGAPGIPGTNGRNGIDGEGVMIVPTSTELHNNLDPQGSGNTGHNYADGHPSWCNIGGYRSGTGNGGQASDIYGYECYLSSGSGVRVEGYGNEVTTGSEGTHTEGKGNKVNRVDNGTHIEGMNHGYITPISLNSQGVHLEGFGFQGLPSGINISDGAHIGGYGITSNAIMFSMPHQMSSGESGYIRLIGTKTGTTDSKIGLALRNDGCLGVAGDIAFTALDSGGAPITTGPNADGRYTLGEIVQALIDAGILTPPL